MRDMRTWRIVRPPLAAASLLAGQLAHAAWRDDLPTLQNQDPSGEFGDPSAPPVRIVFLGDNLNDLDAGQSNGVHFIGFHVAAHKRRRLRDHGAETVFGDHRDTRAFIEDLLGL